MNRLCPTVLFAVALILLTSPTLSQQQEYGTRLGVQRGGEVSFSPYGPGVLFDALDPAVKKWYVPQELYNEYQWLQWEYSNYARELYQRYVDISLEGDYFYDLFGDYVTHGWLIFNNSQTQPQQFGSSLLKANRFQRWFSNVAIASDSKGQYYYALTVSSQLRTTLTPMTFSKPNWDGLQFDFASDKYEGTFIYSRISSPGGSSTDDLEQPRTNLTSLLGGRAIAQVGDFSKVGLHFVNTHQSNTLISGFKGNPVAGVLTVDQNSTISFIEIVLRDDSPEDGTGGAAYFPAGSDIIITYADGAVDRGKELRFEPITEGGFVREGFLSADGAEQIRLRYDFDSPAFVSRGRGTKEEIEKVEFELTVGNDYQVWITSDRQLNASGNPVLLLLAQAEGNVQDNTNLRILRFEYGLPTATQILGGTLELQNVAGFNFYGEYNLNLNYRQYPNIARRTHSTSAGVDGDPAAEAWMVNLSRIFHPWFFFVEAYSMDPLYNSLTFITAGDGFIDYSDTRRYVVELVDDNDDQDRYPDWIRSDNLQGDVRVFPGWDENNDFIPDFNQNDNFFRSNDMPDYEESFLRHNVDPPEFLFGIDMNNNLWIDRFENDELADYPYPKDHRGVNAYIGYCFTPNIRLTAGHLRERRISSEQENRTSYAMLTVDRDTPRHGRLRFFQMVKLARDDIADDLLQWFPDVSLKNPQQQIVPDPLLARNTWINSTWLGHRFHWGSLEVVNQLKYDLYHQRYDDATRAEYGLQRANDYFFSVVDKVSYRFTTVRLTVEPRWKSVYQRQSRDLISAGEVNLLTEIFGVVVSLPMLNATKLQAGLEFSVATDFDGDTGDGTGLAIATQATNATDYLGYRLTTQVGMKVDRRDLPGRAAETTTLGFITMYAGLTE